MTKCIKHEKNINNVTVPCSECEICIENAFNPHKCMICRENDGNNIADELVVCPSCESLYFDENISFYKKYVKDIIMKEMIPIDIKKNILKRLNIDLNKYNDLRVKNNLDAFEKEITEKSYGQVDIMYQQKRYELYCDDVLINGIPGLTFEVIPEPKDDPQGITKPHVSVMTGDDGETGHTILGNIQFNDEDNLKLFQTGLELMDKALVNEADSKEWVDKSNGKSEDEM